MNPSPALVHRQQSCRFFLQTIGVLTQSTGQDFLSVTASSRSCQEIQTQSTHIPLAGGESLGRKQYRIGAQLPKSLKALTADDRVTIP